jgi:hypothetical protein
MSATLVEPLDISICTAQHESGSARAEASRANGRLSRGPSSPEGKDRSRRNGCKDGLTGKGIVLPQAAAAEVDRREAELARDFRPRNAVERELVRQMALGSWRSRELGTRIAQHDARVNAARFTNWVEDERIAAVEIGHRLGEDPEAAVARLRRSSAGCDWMIGRFRLLGRAISASDDGEPGCAWTDADLAMVLGLLGRPAGLRHLDDWPGRLEAVRDEARSGSAEAAAELREIIQEQLAELEERSDEAWEELEKPLLLDWQAGVAFDLGPEGTRLRRYEAAADRLFRSAWRKLELLRKERGEPLMPRVERDSAPSPAGRYSPPAVPPPAPPSAPPAQAPVRPEPLIPVCSPRGGSATTVLDFWVAGPPRAGMTDGFSSRDKTNPAPGRPAKAGRAEVLEVLASGGSQTR